MGKVLTAVAVAAAIGATGVSVSLYLKLHPELMAHARTEPQTTGPIAQRTKQPGQPDPELEARRAATRASIRASLDDWLTGDPNGRAEWKAPDNDDYVCGVTPEGRYFIKQNEYGRARHDEPDGPTADFDRAWGNLNCEKTAPVNQNRLLIDKYEEAEYNRSHPINDECLFAEMRASAAGRPGGMAKDPHYCQNGHYERDQAAKKASGGSADTASGATSTPAQ